MRRRSAARVGSRQQAADRRARDDQCDIGRAWTSNKDYDRAIESFDAALEWGPSAEVLRRSAYAHFMRKCYTEALAALDAAVALEPFGDDVYELRARVQTKLKRLEPAHEDAEPAVFLDGFDSDNPAWRGYVAELRGDKKAARIDYERALELEEMEWIARRLAKLGGT